MRLIDAEKLLDWLTSYEQEDAISGEAGALFADTRDIREAIKLAPTITPQRWTRVTERLPEASGDYIVTMIDGDGKLGVGWTDVCAFVASDGHWEPPCDCAVTHWMPLPALPKEA